MDNLITREEHDFYSHALVGRDKREDYFDLGLPNFYSHALVGRDGVGARIAHDAPRFLLTRPRGA